MLNFNPGMNLGAFAPASPQSGQAAGVSRTQRAFAPEPLDLNAMQNNPMNDPMAGMMGGMGTGGDIDLQGLCQVLMMLLAQLANMLLGGGGSLPGAGGGGGDEAAGGNSGGGSSGGGKSCQGSGGGKQLSTPKRKPGGSQGTQGGNSASGPLRANDADVNKALNDIRQDPEGKILVEEAERKGVKIKVGGVMPGAAGQYEPDTNTIVVGEYNDMSDLRSLLVHELVHATTPENDNSLKEEAFAQVVGERVEARISGKPQSDGQQQAYFREQLEYLPSLRGMPYGSMRRSNSIQEDLGRMGLQFNFDTRV